jgi:hypothetical protein
VARSRRTSAMMFGRRPFKLSSHKLNLPTI